MDSGLMEWFQAMVTIVCVNNKIFHVKTNGEGKDAIEQWGANWYIYVSG
jgi:hypothetical protein